MRRAQPGVGGPSSATTRSVSAAGTQTWEVLGSGGPAQVTCPAPRAAWSEIVEADPFAQPSHLPVWLDCICQADGWTDASRLYEMPDGRQVVFPLVSKALAGTPGLSKLLTVQASFPHGWGSGGILAPGGIRNEDVALVLADLAKTAGLRTLVRPGFTAAAVWGEAWSQRGGRRGARQIPVTTHVLDLRGGIEEVWSTRMSAKVRSGIRNARRKAEKAGLEIEVGSSPQLVADFYDVYLRWVDSRAQERRMPREVARWRGRRAEPLRRYQTVAAAFGERCRIWVARLDEIPVASGIALFHGQFAVGWRAFSDREVAAPLRASELMQFHAFEYACQIGCQHFCIGTAGGSAGLLYYKNRIGATQHDVAEYAFERLPISRLQAGAIELRGGVESRVLARYRSTHGGRDEHFAGAGGSAVPGG